MGKGGEGGGGRGPSRAGQKWIYVISKFNLNQLIVRQGCVYYTPNLETCAPSWPLCECSRAPADRLCDSAPRPPLHPSLIPRHCSTSCCTNRRFQGTPAPQHGQSFLAALAAHPAPEAHSLRAALAAVAADCSTHSPRFAQALLAGWLSPRAADCTSSGDLASHWTRRSSGETPAR